MLNSLRGQAAEPDGWPKSPQGLVSALRRLTPTLKQSNPGWHVQLGVRDSTAAHGRLVVIVKVSAIVERAAILEYETGMTPSEAEEKAALEAAS